MSISLLDQEIHSVQKHLKDYVDKNKLIGKRHYVEVSAEGGSTPNWDGVYSFKINKSGNKFINNVNYIIDLPALGGSGGSYERFVNGMGIFMFSRVELLADNDVILTTYSNEAFDNVQLHCGTEDYSLLKDHLLIQSTSDRNTSAGSTDKLQCNLSVWFDIFSKRIPRALINQDIEVRFYIRPLAQVVQTDHSTKASDNLVNLKLHIEYVENDKVFNFLKNVHDEYLKSSELGVDFFVHEFIRQTHNVAGSSATNFDIKLSAMQNINMTILNFKSLLASYTTNWACDYDTLQSTITQFSLKNQSNSIYLKSSDITVATDYAYLILPRSGFENMSLLKSLNSYFLYWFDHGKDFHDASEHMTLSYDGALNLKQYDDPQLNITLSSTSSAQTILLYALRPFKLSINREGKLVKVY